MSAPQLFAHELPRPVNVRRATDKKLKPNEFMIRAKTLEVSAHDVVVNIADGLTKVLAELSDPSTKEITVTAMPIESPDNKSVGWVVHLDARNGGDKRVTFNTGDRAFIHREKARLFTQYCTCRLCQAIGDTLDEVDQAASDFWPNVMRGIQHTYHALTHPQVPLEPADLTEASQLAETFKNTLQPALGNKLFCANSRSQVLIGIPDSPGINVDVALIHRSLWEPVCMCMAFLVMWEVAQKGSPSVDRLRQRLMRLIRPLTDSPKPNMPAFSPEDYEKIRSAQEQLLSQQATSTRVLLPQVVPSTPTPSPSASASASASTSYPPPPSGPSGAADGWTAFQPPGGPGGPLPPGSVTYHHNIMPGAHGGPGAYGGPGVYGGPVMYGGPGPVGSMPHGVTQPAAPRPAGNGAAASPIQVPIADPWPIRVP